ncbi:MAG: bacteriochlorophyll 4-vinyl reductase [Pikeienuella sp.]
MTGGVAGVAGVATPARVGPNAVLQMAAALAAEGGPDFAARIFDRAGLADLLAAPPKSMVAEDIAARLHRTVIAEMAPERASCIARSAGRRTADYLLAHRIPGPAQRLLKALPPRWAAQLLLLAIRRSAWTFAGSGRFRACSGNPSVIEIVDNPLAVPGCPWHAAVFERLFRVLVSPATVVVETDCCARNAGACRFEIWLSGRG